MARREETLQRTRSRVQELIREFGSYVDAFETAGLFTGPSLFFHFKTLQRLKQYPTVTQAIQNESFLESLYATLTSWGMHRMGPGNTRLVEFERFKRSFSSQATAIEMIADRIILDLQDEEVDRISRHLWTVIRSLEVGVGEAKIVAGSKALHHVLPNLVPPIDREYTLRFFCNNKTLRADGAEEFAEIYPAFHQIARACELEIRSRLTHPERMHTSFTKVVDNGVVGYRLRHLQRDEDQSLATEAHAP